ncbi:hypothetical protein PybrP1_005397, partial [[Pythium] brassicae (nom. inval.)]
RLPLELPSIFDHVGKAICCEQVAAALTYHHALQEYLHSCEPPVVTVAATSSSSSAAAAAAASVSRKDKKKKNVKAATATTTTTAADPTHEFLVDDSVFEAVAVPFAFFAAINELRGAKDEVESPASSFDFEAEAAEINWDLSIEESTAVNTVILRLSLLNQTIACYCGAMPIKDFMMVLIVAWIGTIRELLSLSPAGSVLIRRSPRPRTSHPQLQRSRAPPAMENLYPPSVHELQRGKAPAVFPLAVNNACAEIKDACKALGVDEKALTRVLSSVTPDDRTLIAHRYKELYLEELKFLLKSEVSGDFGFLLQLLAVSLDEAEAYVLHAAVTGPLNTGQIVFPVLLGRTNAELAILKKTYFDIFNQELSAMVNAELGGDLRKIVVTALQTRMVPFDPSVHTDEKAEHDAEALYKSGEGKWGTDEEGFTKIVLSSPPEHLAAVNAIYGSKYASSIKDAIEKEFSGDAKDALTGPRSGSQHSDRESAREHDGGLWHEREGAGCDRDPLPPVPGRRGSRVQGAVRQVAQGAHRRGDKRRLLDAARGAAGRADVGSVLPVVCRAASGNVSRGSNRLQRRSMFRIYDARALDAYKQIHATASPAIDAACAAIHAACKGLGTDEAELIRVLTAVAPFERELIALRFKALHGRELSHLLRSEVSGDFGYLLQLLCVPLPEAEAFVLHRACRGAGTTERVIYPVLLGRTNEEIHVLKKTYFDKYNEDLSVLMDSELGGDFKKVILAALQAGQVDFNTSYHTKERAEQDAEALYKAGQGKWGTDEETFIKILLTSPPHYIELLNDVYCRKYGNAIVVAIEKEFGGDAKRALLFYVRLCLDPFHLIAEHFESTMKGLGTDEKGLSAAVVRYQPWLSEITKAYEGLYRRSLKERIHGEIDTSGAPDVCVEAAVWRNTAACNARWAAKPFTGMTETDARSGRTWCSLEY